jgi:hypothetical protein
MLQFIRAIPTRRSHRARAGKLVLVVGHRHPSFVGSSCIANGTAYVRTRLMGCVLGGCWCAPVQGTAELAPCACPAEIMHGPVGVVLQLVISKDQINAVSQLEIASLPCSATGAGEDNGIDHIYMKN